MNKYDDVERIWSNFDHLKDFNKKWNFSEFKNYKFIIIWAIEEDDIHKAIKYGVWTSTKKHNEKLKNLLKNNKLLLIFWIVK